MRNESKQNLVTLQSYKVSIFDFFIHAINMNKTYIFCNYNEIIIDNSVIIKRFESKSVIPVMFLSFLGGGVK